MKTRSRQIWSRTLAVVFAVFGLVVVIASLVVALLGDAGAYEALGGPWWILGPSFIMTGGPIAILRPGHPIGWIFLWLGFGAAASGALSLLAFSAPERLPIEPAWAFVIGPAINTLVIASLLPLALLLFPDGRPLSPRWRWAVWLTIPVGLLGALGALLVGGWGGDPSQLVELSPLYEEFGELGESLSAVFFPLLSLLLVSSAVSIILRYRRSSGESRKQLQWLAFAGAVLVVMYATQTLMTGGINVEGGFAAVVFSLGFVLIPVAAAVAILRYRLYDIDLVVSRSLLIAGLAGFITLVYVAVVVGIGTLIGTGDEPNLVLQIVATALVAVLFQPMRRRLRRWADRLIYGDRATPYEVLAAFSQEAARTPDETSLAEIARLLADGTGAEPAVVWLRVGNEIVPTAAAPELDGWANHGPYRDIEELPGDLVVPVSHEGELFGALSVFKPRGEQVSPQDEKLAGQLASGVGVALRNVGLTSELRIRLEELKDSRRRLVTAQDATRQKLERDLHDGAQQELVALKVKLGLAKRLAEKSGADKTAGLISDLLTDADGAVETLRDLARGIYPPLLEAEGLAVAIEAQARKAPLPITVHSAGVGRYDRDVEAAVYFCVLEAMTNAIRYSNAKSVHIRLIESDGALTFIIEDDGEGFDSTVVASGSGLAGMADRLDTVGGAVEIDSKHGQGTSIRGRVPIRTKSPMRS